MNKLIGMLFLLVVFTIGLGSFSFAYANELNQENVVSYKVKKGDMLRLISLKYYGTELKARFLAKANGIKNPDLIFAESTIKIPIINKKGNAGKLNYSRNNLKKIQSKGIETVREISIAKSEKTVIKNESSAQVDDAIKEKTETHSLTELKTAQQVQEIPSTLNEKENSVSNIVPTVEDKLKLAEVKKEPVSKSTLEFTADDVMPKNAPETRDAESHVHSASNFDALEHQLSLNTFYSKNKSDRMVGGMLDYMAWVKTPKIGENYSLGAGAFTSVWEDKISNAHIRGVMPGVQFGLKYNRHTDDHLMRMVYGKLMVGKEFQSVKQKTILAPAMAADPMTTDETMLTDDAMNSQPSSDSSMSQAMPIKSGSNFRIGSMLGVHYQLNPKSTLELMNENWFSLGGKTAMEMDPAFSLIASHVYTSGDWSWRLGIGPQYEDWSKTWRLHVVPAEITYKEMVTLGVFSELYPWKKGEMYSGFSTQDLNSIGAVLRFNIGTSMHKGHEAKDH
ncbi:MAG: hypothetical protein ACD_9C00049G0001 [uncultured bacterium]|nr:MAG: hypothetical protein ACD_9C00049G0001 [uncultured bacterium]